jgi:hypothetical protein
MQKSTYTPPSRAELESIARSFVKENTPRREYRQLLRDNELDEYIESLVNSTEDQAETYIKQGIWPGQAWQWAIRVAICGVEPD